MPAARQKLIVYGKVMDSEDKQLKEYNLKDGDFMVVMIQMVSSLSMPWQQGSLDPDVYRRVLD